MMILDEVLELHRKTTKEETLSGNLGDGFLYLSNSVFRNIRDVAKAFGCRFTSEPFHHYDTYPLLELNNILGEKTIPFKNNVVPLEKVIERHPGIFTMNDFQGMVAKNVISHESSHCIANEFLPDLGKVKYKKKHISSSQKVFLKLILHESFANACDLFPWFWAETPMHKIFLNANSYALDHKESRERGRYSIEEIGFKKTFQLTMLAFLYSNYLFKSVSRPLFKGLLRVIEIPESTISTSAAELHYFFSCNDLPNGFKFRTATVTLKSEGISESVFDMSRLDPLVILNSNPEIMDYIFKMSELIELGIYSKAYEAISSGQKLKTSKLRLAG